MRCPSKFFAVGLLTAAMVSCGGSSSTGDFTVSVVPTSLGIVPSVEGNQVIASAYIAPKAGFNGQISVTVNPAGLLTIKPPMLSTGSNGGGQYVLTFTPSQSLSPGTYPFNLNFSSGSLHHAVNMTLQAQ